MIRQTASSGHKLGQIIGDWFEEHFAMRILEDVASELGLFLDTRFKKRKCRGEKIIWEDQDGNHVDYDFVLELNGDDENKGVPVAFFETFWRRGSRHSKDKARDDSGKLMPMKLTYPTARILGIISAGDFTQPAQELVKSRDIDLFYIPKQKIVESWRKVGLEIDYPDALDEQSKKAIVHEVEKRLDEHDCKTKISTKLFDILGSHLINNYKDRLKSQMSAPPIEFSISPLISLPSISFESFDATEEFLNSKISEQIKTDDFSKLMLSYKATYSDGTVFLRENLYIHEAKSLHSQVGQVLSHFEKINC